MIKKAIILITLFGGTISSQNDTIQCKKPAECYQKGKFAISMESNVMQITSNFNFKRVGFNGSLGLEYYFTHRLYGGLFYTKMQDISKGNTLYIIDQKVIDVSTSEFANFGFSFGYDLFRDERLRIIPELRLGYGLYKANSANFGINGSKNTLNVDMLTLHPKVNFLYGITRNFDLGLTGGYLFPFNYSDRSDFKEYNLQNVNVGLHVCFRL